MELRHRDGSGGEDAAPGNVRARSGILLPADCAKLHTIAAKSGNAATMRNAWEEAMLQVESHADIVTIGDVTRHHARTRPDRVAIHFEGQRITFAELDRSASQLANG